MRFALSLLLCLFALPVGAEPLAVLKERRPELFDAATGYRIARQRAPTPDDIPAPAQRIETDRVVSEIAAGAFLLDVAPAQTSRFDELDGTWLVSKPHESIPGATWLPEVGRGRLTDQMQRYLEQNLAAQVAPYRAIIVFCVADCWMSWNAAQRIAAMGHAPVYWYREGISGWRDRGWQLEQVTPVPVQVD